MATVNLLAGPAWQAAGTSGFKLTDPTGIPDGAQKALIKSGAAGKAKALVKGKGTNLPDTLAGVLPLPVTAQLINETTGLCFAAVYDAASVIKNDGSRFKAKAQPEPTIAISAVNSSCGGAFGFHWTLEISWAWFSADTVTWALGPYDEPGVLLSTVASGELQTATSIRGSAVASTGNLPPSIFDPNYPLGAAVSFFRNGELVEEGFVFLCYPPPF